MPSKEKESAASSAEQTLPQATSTSPPPTGPSVDTSSLLHKTVQIPLNQATSFLQNMTPNSPLEIVKEPLQGAKEWNTKNLRTRIVGDAVAAAAAGGLVAPLISIIDRGIIENASGKANLTQSMKSSFASMFTRPHTFLASKQFLLVFALYGGTYLSANSLDTFTSTIRSRSASSVTAGTSKFVTTSITNLSLCLYKDSQFTKMFGAASSGGRAVPPVTYALFAVRDCMTVFASFNLPPVLAPMLPVSAEVEKYASRASIAQFLAPAGVQILSTPLHLVGLDLFNRPRGEGVSISSRTERVLRDWAKSCAARIGRIVPAFGVGGVVNTSVRNWWMKSLG